MKKRLFVVTTFAALIGTSAMAADVAVKALPVPSLSPACTWCGWYVGVTAGTAWGQYDARTSTVPDGYLNGAQAAAVTAAGAQTITANGFATGIEGGYNWQIGNLLLGIEADLQAIHLTGATSSGAVPYPGKPAVAFTVTSYATTNWLLTARPRLGFVAPNHWLFYATGGLALTRLQDDFAFWDDNTTVPTFGHAIESGNVYRLKAGYAVGAGIEAPLTDRLSLKADYLHAGFANTTGVSTINNLMISYPGQVISHSSNLNADIFRAGLNYRFGDPGVPTSGDAIEPFWKKLPIVVQEFEVEAGARLWFSRGSVGAPQPGMQSHVSPTERLTWSGLDAISGETFARIDHTSGFNYFIKGNLGAGEITAGRLDNEDFFGNGTGVQAYSHQQSVAGETGHLGYATIDLGYNFVTAPAARVGAFVGRNYYAQALNTFGCQQIAAATVFCVPASPPTVLSGPSENDHINSLRLGLSSEAMLTPRLKLTADAAYVPWANFSGFDDHLSNQFLIFESSNRGDGVMLEAMIDYYITNAWSVGIGGRYWAWNLNTGTASYDNLLMTPANSGVQASRFTTERYGMFVQSSYRWGDPARSAAKASLLASQPMNWTGFYVGGHVGGGRSTGRWSDPFGSTVSPQAVLNVAGFGDVTRAPGPLGGGQVGANWQTGPWVMGAEADASWADLRGENTCFSGIGGMDCQHIDKEIGTITGRTGYAWDRSLAYVKGGGAWDRASYNLFGNTQATLAQFAGTANLTTWGWTVGAGIEYALTNNWSALAEYDHIGLPSATVPFPTVPIVKTASVGVSQSMDLLKLGVNYKFDFAALSPASAKN